ncbi:MAG: bactofilin family protein [Burkholderiaceae bacterium]|jgi:cytoskeletal protein CcmA (bactofilin family)
MSDNETKGDLFLGKGVLAHCVAFVPGRAVVNGKFDGAIDAKELDVQVDGVVSGTTQASAISVSGQLNNSVHATNTLVIGSTGRVRGDISYGNLEIARGGEILGEMKKF